MEFLLAALGALSGTVVGGLITFASSRSLLRRELEFDYDRELRNRRMIAYMSLYRRTACAPRYWPTNPVRSEVRVWADVFDEWYFNEAGGLFLTDEARKQYLDLLEVLADVSRAAGPDRLTEEEVVSIWQAGQALRRRIAADVGAADAPRVPGRAPLQSPHPRARFTDVT